MYVMYKPEQHHTSHRRTLQLLAYGINRKCYDEVPAACMMPGSTLVHLAQVRATVPAQCCLLSLPCHAQHTPSAV
jgi:hypothetical protein